MSFISNIFKGASNDFTPNGNSVANTAYTNSTQGLDTLAAALKQQMNGGGPNLANQQLQNATGQNIANQAALQAGQRGASGNVGLMSRQIAQQGGQLQQQAAGQSASNVLAQQLAAQQQLGGVLGTQGQLGASVLNANNAINSNEAGQNAKMNQGVIGGISGVAGKIFGLAEGGAVPSQNPFGFWSDSWGEGNNFNFSSNFANNRKPRTKSMDEMNQSVPASSMQVLGARPQMIQDPTQQFAGGGQANRLPFSPQTDYRAGGPVMANSDNQKAILKGNSPRNDKIPAMLSENEGVIDRETMNDPGPVGKMARAVIKHIESKKVKK